MHTIKTEWRAGDEVLLMSHSWESSNHVFKGRLWLMLKLMVGTFCRSSKRTVCMVAHCSGRYLCCIELSKNKEHFGLFYLLNSMQANKTPCIALYIMAVQQPVDHDSGMVRKYDSQAAPLSQCFNSQYSLCHLKTSPN